jgi:hypothetical protein
MHTVVISDQIYRETGIGKLVSTTDDKDRVEKGRQRMQKTVY